MKEKWFELVQELREDNAKKQKKGLHFILTSVFIWGASNNYNGKK